jgi:hypothetical protein
VEILPAVIGKGPDKNQAASDSGTGIGIVTGFPAIVSMVEWSPFAETEIVPEAIIFKRYNTLDRLAKLATSYLW